MASLRLDRLATTCLYYPIKRVLGPRRTNRIPILMYHAVQDELSGMAPYYETNVAPHVFARQMKELREKGYQAISLGQALDSMDATEAHSKNVVITFDDGYGDFYERAFPVLSEYGFTATVYLPSGYIGEQQMEFKKKRCLSWNQVRELHSRGIHFGSHTVTHPMLRELPLEQVDQEIGRSKKNIEDHLGAAVQSFSYPYAFPEADRKFVRRLKDILVTHGYANGVTTIVGTAQVRSDRYFLPRLPVNHWDDPPFFQAKLEGAYDWLHGFQYAAKLIHAKAH